MLDSSKKFKFMYLNDAEKPFISFIDVHNLILKHRARKRNKKFEFIKRSSRPPLVFGVERNLEFG